jgi:hypothetical protein
MEAEQVAVKPKVKVIGLRITSKPRCQELLAALNNSCNSPYGKRTLTNKVHYLVCMALGICPATEEVVDNIRRCLDTHIEEQRTKEKKAVKEAVQNVAAEIMQPRHGLRLVK